MPPKPAEALTAVANRCSCGHYPGAHMVVRPVSEELPGSFQLVPAGPCLRCGSQCARYTPTP